MSSIGYRQGNALFEMRTVPNSGQTLTVSDTPVQLHADAVPPNGKVIRVMAVAGDATYTTDGSTPNPATGQGFALFEGDSLYLSHRQAQDLRLIRNGVDDADIYSEALRY